MVLQHILGESNNRIMKLIPPLVTSHKSMVNFVFKSSTLWNRLLPNILSKCKPEASGLIIPGSALNSDLSAPISFVKLKLKSALLASQRKDHLSQW